MKITDKLTGKVFIMPKIEQKYLNRAKKSELKILYNIFMCGGEFDVEKVCAETEESLESVNSALAFWRCAGIIGDGNDETDNEKSVSEKKNKVTLSDAETKTVSAPSSSYSLPEITAIKERDKVFSSLVAYFEKISGHLYNSSEQSLILYLYDTMGIDCEVIMGVAQYCASTGKNSVRYIHNTCINIHEKGVRTYAELEAYFAAGKKKVDFESMVKAIVGADDRAFTAAERKHIEKWHTVYGCSEELVSYAYEKTISKINKPQISYMSKILEGWHEKGLKTKDSVDEFFATGEKKKTVSSGGRLEFNLDDIFEKPDIPIKPV